jgi:hypothetical protein
VSCMQAMTSHYDTGVVGTGALGVAPVSGHVCGCTPGFWGASAVAVTLTSLGCVAQAAAPAPFRLAIEGFHEAGRMGHRPGGATPLHPSGLRPALSPLSERGESWLSTEHSQKYVLGP